MSTRKVKDGKVNGEKVYFTSHAQATFMSDGRSVEEAINNIGNGGDYVTTTMLLEAIEEAITNTLAEKV